MRLLKALLLFAFLFVGLMGYLYFGPSQYTGFVTRTSFFRLQIAPVFDRLLSSGGVDSEMIAYLEEGDGDVAYRPNTELVSLPARSGQSLSAGTLVSTGEGAVATVSLVDQSKIRLEPNSTILLDAPREGDGLSSVTLKIVTGAVVAEKSKASDIQIRVVTPKGVSKTLTDQKLTIVTPRRSERQTRTLLLAPKTDEEFIGVTDKPVQEIQKRIEIEDRSMRLASIAPPEEPEPIRPLAMAVETPPPPPVYIPLPPSTGLQLAPVEVSRLPASVPEPFPAGDSKAVELEAARVAAEKAAAEKVAAEKAAALKARLARVPAIKWKAPPSGSDITRALYAERVGKTGESKRLMARALTQRTYASLQSFNDATRVALDGLLEGYVSRGNRQLADDTIRNVERSYPKDPAAVSWANRWRARLGRNR